MTTQNEFKEAPKEILQPQFHELHGLEFPKFSHIKAFHEDS